MRILSVRRSDRDKAAKMMTYRFKLTQLLGLILPVGMVLLGSELALGQGPARGPNPNTGVTIQLPSLGVFGVNTVVSVPDGGTTRRALRVW